MQLKAIRVTQAYESNVLCVVLQSIVPNLNTDNYELKEK